MEIFRSKKGKEMIEEKKMKNIYLLSVKRTRTHLTSSSLPTKLSLSCTFYRFLLLIYSIQFIHYLSKPNRFHFIPFSVDTERERERVPSGKILSFLFFISLYLRVLSEIQSCRKAHVLYLLPCSLSFGCLYW